MGALNRNEVNMAAQINGNRRMSKSDAQTIAQGEQLASDIDKRLRSASGQIYHAETSVHVDYSKNNDKMGSIAEVLDQGGIDHAEVAQEDPMCLTRHQQKGCCEGSSQIIELIHKLQESVNSMDSKISASSAFQAVADKRITDLEKQQVQGKKEMAYISDSLQQYQVKVDILCDTVIKQQQEIKELKNQMIDAQARGMKSNITISGIPEKAQENCIQETQKFFVEKLLITDKLIPIDQAYRFGSGKMRPMLVTLRHWTDKSIIFEQVKHLKGMKVDGVQCFVASQLPEALNEKRRKNNSYMAANNKRPAAKKLPYSIKQGELMYKDKPIKPRVWPPTPRELLKLTEPEIEEINEIKLISGVIEEKDENTFKGLAIAASDHEQIRKAYKKVKLTHGEAAHIACAYKLEKAKPPIDADGCDDGEFGAARVLQKAIDQSGMNNVAVFMVRFFGKKIGPMRFDLINKVAESALTLLQVSLQESPNSWHDTESAEEATSTKSDEDGSRSEQEY